MVNPAAFPSSSASFPFDIPFPKVSPLPPFHFLPCMHHQNAPPLSLLRSVSVILIRWFACAAARGGEMSTKIPTTPILGNPGKEETTPQNFCEHEYLLPLIQALLLLRQDWHIRITDTPHPRESVIVIRCVACAAAEGREDVNQSTDDPNLRQSGRDEIEMKFGSMRASCKSTTTPISPLHQISPCCGSGKASV